ncbi:MAG: Crp/Fnr family transcriptional regulator, partial [Bacteroidia bacterium]
NLRNIYDRIVIFVVSISIYYLFPMGTPPLAIRRYMDLVLPLSDEAWAAATAILVEQSFAKGERFAQKGRVEKKFGILTQGLFKAYTLNDNGQEAIQIIFTPLHFQTPKSYVGALRSLLTGESNQVYIECLSPAKLWVGEYDAWRVLAQSYPEIQRWSRRMAELFVVSKEQDAHEMISHQAEQRYENFKKRYPELEALIPQYEIARFLHISPTQLSRIRSAQFLRRAND